MYWSKWMAWKFQNQASRHLLDCFCLCLFAQRRWRTKPRIVRTCDLNQCCPGHRQRPGGVGLHPWNSLLVGFHVWFRWTKPNIIARTYNSQMFSRNDWVARTWLFCFTDLVADLHHGHLDANAVCELHFANKMWHHCRSRAVLPMWTFVQGFKPAAQELYKYVSDFRLLGRLDTIKTIPTSAHIHFKMTWHSSKMVNVRCQASLSSKVAILDVFL